MKVRNLSPNLALEANVEVGILVTLWEISANPIWPLESALEFIR